MNERIEHCLYQSGLTAQGCWDELDDYAKEAIEKFAELIIRECSKAVFERDPNFEPIAYIYVLKYFGIQP